MEQETMVFQLSENLSYAKGADWVETATLEFTSPTPNEFEEACDLSQLVTGAIMEASKFAPEKQEETAKEDVEIDKNAIKALLLSAQSIKFKDVVKRFESLALKIGTTDGTTKLTPDILKKLTVDDRMDLACEYIANFTLPSLNLGEG